MQSLPGRIKGIIKPQPVIEGVGVRRRRSIGTMSWGAGSNKVLAAALCLEFLLFCSFLPNRLAADQVRVQDASEQRKGSSPSFDTVAKQAAEAREANRLEEAVEFYRAALRLRPSWGEGRWYLATLLYELDRYAEAREAFRRVVVVEAGNGAAWGLLGLCEFQLKEHERALDAIQRARSLGFSGNSELVSVTRYHAAILLTRFEEFEAALEILFAFARDHNENIKIIEALGLAVLRMPLLPSEVPSDRRELVLLAGRAAFHQGARRTAEARLVYQELAKRYADLPNVHYAYGVFLAREDPDAALDEFHKEIEISPSHVAARLQIAFEHIKRGNYSSALARAREAVKLAPRNFAARNALGRALLETGDVTRAVAELETGLKLAPDSPEMHFALARAYTRAGRKADAERARAEFQRLDKQRRALREGPQSVTGSNAKDPAARRP